MISLLFPLSFPPAECCDALPVGEDTSLECLGFGNEGALSFIERLQALCLRSRAPYVLVLSPDAQWRREALLSLLPLLELHGPDVVRCPLGGEQGEDKCFAHWPQDAYLEFLLDPGARLESLIVRRERLLSACERLQRRGRRGPGADWELGLEVLREARTFASSTPVVSLTGASRAWTDPVSWEDGRWPFRVLSVLREHVLEATPAPRLTPHQQELLSVMAGRAAQDFSSIAPSDLQAYLLAGAELQGQYLSRMRIEGALRWEAEPSMRPPATSTRIFRAAQTPEAPRASVIVPVFNQLAYTRQCLERLDMVGAALPYELIVIDNGSSDGTLEWLSARPEVSIIHNEQNQGFARACNQGAELARADILVFLNNDTLASPGWLEPLVETLADPEVGAVGSKLLFPDGTLQHAGMAIYRDLMNGGNLDFRHRFFRFPGNYPDAQEATDVSALTGAVLAVRKPDFELVGGFDEGYWNGCEDVALCFALAARGLRLRYEPRSSLIHYESASGAERWRRVTQNFLKIQRDWRSTAPGAVTLSSTSQALLEVEDASVPQPIPGLLSVVCVVRNDAEALRSLSQAVSGTATPIELIVVDDASTDETALALEELASRTPRVKGLSNRQERGWSLSANQGAALASGEIVVFWEPGVALSSDAGARIQAHFEVRSDLGILGPLMNRGGALQRLELVTEAPEAGVLEEELAALGAGTLALYAGECRPCASLDSGFLAVRQTGLRQVGGFDPRFRTRTAAVHEFCFRLQTAGLQACVALDLYAYCAPAASEPENAVAQDEGYFASKWNLPEGLVKEGALIGTLRFHPAAHAIPLPDLELPSWQASIRQIPNSALYPLEGCLRRTLWMPLNGAPSAREIWPLKEEELGGVRPEEITLVLSAEPGNPALTPEMVTGFLPQGWLPDLLLLPEPLTKCGAQALSRSVDAISERLGQARLEA